MPALVPPRLDDRTWQELRDELVARIPVHDPAWTWTDHNASDPGIALLEVFAWLGESLLRRMDRVPDNARLEFLRLLGVQPRTAAVATGRVRLDLAKGALTPQLVAYSPADPRLQLAAGKQRFSAKGEAQVLPVEAQAAVKITVPLLEVDDDELERVRQALKVHIGLDPASEESPDLAPYETSPLAAPVGGRLGPAIELADTADSTLWVALLAPKAVLKAHAIEAVRDALAGTVVSVGLWTDDELEPGEIVACPDTPDESDVRWEVSTGAFLGEVETVEHLAYDRLAVENDTTDSGTRSGVVRLRLPSAERLGMWSLDDGDGRVIDGVGDLPPAFDDDDLEERVVVWLRMRRVDGPPRRVRWADVNIVEVEHAVLAGRELLGTGSATAGLTVRVSKVPALAESVRLEVREPTAGWVSWTRVHDLAGSRGDDPHFLFDPATGEITFGDGISGRMPRISEPIRVASYRWGGGAVGNLPAGSLSKVVGPAALATLRVAQDLPTTGGADPQTIDEAKVELPKVLRHNDRAVAKDDFRDLAMATPGAGLGRVEVLPRHLPAGHVDEVPGLVTCILVPAWDRLHPDEPVPDRETVRRVCAWLEPRRLCTTELYLVAPEYIEVWVSVAVTAKEGYGLQTVKRWVELAVRQHLAPLPPFGPTGKGWPFGRDVRPADIEAAAVAVDGVEIVTQVLLRGIAVDRNGNTTAIATVDPCDPQTIPIERWQLPVVRAARVAMGEEAPPLDDTPDPETGGWPVPAVRETC